jgi:hypothetical protein
VAIVLAADAPASGLPAGLDAKRSAAGIGIN